MENILIKYEGTLSPQEALDAINAKYPNAKVITALKLKQRREEKPKVEEPEQVIVDNTCRDCNGLGHMFKDKSSKLETCDICGGTGVIA